MTDDGKVCGDCGEQMDRKGFSPSQPGEIPRTHWKCPACGREVGRIAAEHDGR